MDGWSRPEELGPKKVLETRVKEQKQLTAKMMYYTHLIGSNLVVELESKRFES